MDEQVIRERVAGLSGLGLAEEQRVKRAMQTILSDQANLSSEQRIAAIDQLRIQAARLAVTIQRHLTDQKILKDGCEDLIRQVDTTSADCERLEEEKEFWIQRNRRFEEYEEVCKQILAAGPPSSIVEEEIRSIDLQIEELNRRIMTERVKYDQDIQRITDLIHQLKTI